MAVRRWLRRWGIGFGAWSLAGALAGAEPRPSAPAPDVELRGAIRFVAPPVDFTAVFDNDRMLVLREARGVRLAAPLAASFVTTGRFEKKTDQVRGTLPAGLVVNSYFFITTTGGVARYRGAVRFGRERIVAVVAYPELTASHPWFALDGTIYDIMGGIDLAPAGGPDAIAIAADRRTLEFDFVDLGLHDSFRVLTVSDEETPEASPR